MKIILELSSVELSAVSGLTVMDRFTLALNAGETIVLHIEPGNEQLPLADAALGLIAPTRGQVRFNGADWQMVTPEQALKLRARIGRVFSHNGWVSNLDVIENVTLSQRHHTRRAIKAILDEAQEQAQKFGLPEIPRGRPAVVPLRDLKRAEWARAFMGTPDFLCLECPGKGAATEHLTLLVAALRQACERGAAALWCTCDEREIHALKQLRNTRHYYMRGAALCPELVTT